MIGAVTLIPYSNPVRHTHEANCVVSAILHSTHVHLSLRQILLRPSFRRTPLYLSFKQILLHLKFQRTSPRFRSIYTPLHPPTRPRTVAGPVPFPTIHQA